MAMDDYVDEDEVRTCFSSFVSLTGNKSKIDLCADLYSTHVEAVARYCAGVCGVFSLVGFTRFLSLLEVWLVWTDKASEKQEKSIRQLAQEARQGNAHDENVLTYYR